MGFDAVAGGVGQSVQFFGRQWSHVADAGAAAAHLDESAAWAVSSAATGRARELAESLPMPTRGMFSTSFPRDVQELGLEQLDGTLLAIRQARAAIAPVVEAAPERAPARLFDGSLANAEQKVHTMQWAYGSPNAKDKGQSLGVTLAKVQEDLRSASFVSTERIQRERHAAIVGDVNRLVMNVRREMEALGPVGADPRAAVHDAVLGTVGRRELRA